MSEQPMELERELVSDLSRLGDRFLDDEFSTELYRALTNNTWSKRDGPDGHVSLSWGRAEAIVNDLRAGRDRPALALAQTGGEGDVSDLVRDELDRLGWTARPLNTGRRDEQHLSQPESPPPAGQGERMAPGEDSHAWERQAHEEAERTRLGVDPPPASGGEAPG